MKNFILVLIGLVVGTGGHLLMSDEFVIGWWAVAVLVSIGGATIGDVVVDGIRRLLGPDDGRGI